MARSYYRTVPPAPVLRRFVECLWVRVIPGAEADGDRRILPDGRMDLVWIQGLGVVVAGPQSRHTARPVVAPMLAFGVRFHPGAAPVLLRLPAVELIDDYVPLSAVDARLAARLGQELARANDDREAFTALNRGLMCQPPTLADGAPERARVAAQAYRQRAVEVLDRDVDAAWGGGHRRRRC